MRTARLKHRIPRLIKDSHGEWTTLDPQKEYPVGRQYKAPTGKKMTELITGQQRTVSLLSSFLTLTPFSAN